MQHCDFRHFGSDGLTITIRRRSSAINVSTWMVIAMVLYTGWHLWSDRGTLAARDPELWCVAAVVGLALVAAIFHLWRTRKPDVWTIDASKGTVERNGALVTEVSGLSGVQVVQQSDSDTEDRYQVSLLSLDGRSFRVACGLGREGNGILDIGKKIGALTRLPVTHSCS